MRERMEERRVTEKRRMMAKNDITCWTCTGFLEALPVYRHL